VAFSFCGGEEMFGWLKRKRTTHAEDMAKVLDETRKQMEAASGATPMMRGEKQPPKFDPHVLVREYSQAFIGNMRISNVQRSQTSLYHKWRFVKRERAITFTGTVAEFREYLAGWR
jgi:hypothetical protein